MVLLADPNTWRQISGLINKVAVEAIPPYWDMENS